MRWLCNSLRKGLGPVREKPPMLEKVSRCAGPDLEKLGTESQNPRLMPISEPSISGRWNIPVKTEQTSFLNFLQHKRNERRFMVFCPYKGADTQSSSGSGHQGQCIARLCRSPVQEHVWDTSGTPRIGLPGIKGDLLKIKTEAQFVFPIFCYLTLPT